jgi:hypothetical protein
MASAKLVVTKAKGGSKITLIGTSGTELMSSKVFVEPRGKGATIRSLKGLLGEKIIVEDHTVASARTEAPVEEAPTVPAAKRSAKSPTTTKAPRAKTPRATAARAKTPRVAAARATAARATSARVTAARAKTPPVATSRAKAVRGGRQTTKSA